LSATDSSKLHLADQLAVRGYEVFLFSTQPFNYIESIEQKKVDSLEAAVLEARNISLDLLIFTYANKQNVVSGIAKCDEISQPSIIWFQNTPSPNMTNLLVNARFVKRGICVSKNQTDGLRDHPIFEKIDYIHNAIDSERLQHPLSTQRNSLRVCYLGSLTPSKGFQHLARAWPRIHQAFPDATLTVLGSAKLYQRNVSLGPLGVAEREFELTEIVPYLGSTREEAQSKGVIFLGLASPKTICSVIASSSIGVVNPNCSGSLETFCTSAIEVQAGGAAVVGANRGGLRETVRNRETGILINSEKQLADAIIKLLANPEQTRQMGEEGERWAKETFNRDRIMDRWCSLLEAVVRDEKPYPPDFSWKRATWKTTVREGIRQARKIPGLGNRVPTLHQLKSRFN
jgi:glycosyltransferase involved in cell wall biosynthesis